MGDMSQALEGLSANEVLVMVILAVATLIAGFVIGALIFRSLGYRKGREIGERDAATIAAKKAKEEASEEIEKIIREAEEKTALLQAEKEASEAKSLAMSERLEQAEKSREEAERAREEAEKSREEVLKSREEADSYRAEAEKSREEAERVAADADRTKEEALQAVIAAEKAKSEAERKVKEVQERILALRESEALGDTIIKTRKKKITLLTKEEILSFADGLNDYLPANIYRRGGEGLPDSCRVGICTFMLVYQRKSMVKLVLRLHKKTAEALGQKYKLFTRAVYPKGDDWYKWILSPDVTDLDVVTAAVRMAYKYVYLLNYDEKTREINVAYANRDEIKINEEILKYKDLPDRDFIVASDVAEGSERAYRLYGKKEMSDYCRSLGGLYPVTVTESDSDLSPNIFRVANKTFLMAYEKDGVSKMIFRLSEEGFIQVVKKHPDASISTFPKAKGYHWYVAQIDETFTSNADIESIIRSACVYVYEKYGAM